MFGKIYFHLNPCRSHRVRGNINVFIASFSPKIKKKEAGREFAEVKRNKNEIHWPTHRYTASNPSLSFPLTSPHGRLYHSHSANTPTTIKSQRGAVKMALVESSK